MADTEVDKNYEFFKKVEDTLLKEHKGEYVVISNAAIDSFHSDFVKAVDYAATKFGIGNFIVQCCEDPKSGTIVFHSRVF